MTHYSTILRLKPNDADCEHCGVDGKAYKVDPINHIMSLSRDIHCVVYLSTMAVPFET